MLIKKKYKALFIFLLVAALLALFYYFLINVRQVKAGEIGVKASIGSVIDNNTNPEVKMVKGYVVFMPICTDFVIYATTIQLAAYDSIRITAQDGVQFYVQPSVSYQLNEKKADLFYLVCKTTFSDANKGYLKQLVSASYATAANSFASDSLVNNKQLFEEKVNTILSNKMATIGLLLRNTVSNMEIPQKIKEILDLRSQALQNAILADDKRKQAEAEALIEIVNANALRKSDSLVNSALTPLAVQKLFIDKWDGKLPVYGDTPKIYKNIND